ncbi:MAG: hypothetical protein WC806_06540 [Candidatus Gracilibacteria bacterium]
MATSLLKRGHVIRIPNVKFSTGEIRNKFCVLLEDGNSFWKNGKIKGCLTTSKIPTPLKPWQIAVGEGFKILGEDQKGTTYIDCRNTIFLKEQQIKQCKFVGNLPDEIIFQFNNADEIAQCYERMT